MNQHSGYESGKTPASQLTPAPRPDLPDPNPHGDYARGGPISSGQWVQAYKGKPQVGERMPASEFLPVLEARATGWQSIPKAVRFAVWVWALSIILSVIGAALAAVIWVIVLIVTFSQQ
jgi:hypothetical protein